MSAVTEIKFDVMLRGRYVTTMKMPLYYADGIDGGGRFVISQETFCRFVESKRPTLKGEPYNIRF